MADAVTLPVVIPLDDSDLVKSCVETTDYIFTTANSLHMERYRTLTEHHGSIPPEKMQKMTESLKDATVMLVGMWLEQKRDDVLGQYADFLVHMNESLKMTGVRAELVGTSVLVSQVEAGE